ncbi:hypothetical protein FB45DRAFT_861435 [Roridomyces roridus]|uniref:Ricin B lectin domain-containing protein n=1 Tax=Roridomyces roridus TaxID=1738132 RepID=A0AAD7FUC8_9AGAR|nr:hypothetical protein FB45DRAFT_861435 [Roridomyces roridus]
MKFMLALTAALVSATMVAGVAAPAPAVPGFTNINDFQGRGLNLVNDAAPGEGTAVTGFPASGATALNQEWSIIPQGTNFTIANALNQTLKLSYPTAGFGGNPHFSGLVVSAQFPANFSIQTSGNGVRIVEVTSGHTLTSWATAGGLAQSPVTLYPISASLQSQQTWTLVASCQFLPVCQTRIDVEIAKFLA